MKATYQKLVILAKAEPKQSIALGVVTVLAAGVLGARRVRSGSDALAQNPETSTAEVLEDREGAPAKPRPKVIVASADPITRDLFVPRPEDFPPPVQTEPISTETSKSATRSDDKTNRANILPQMTAEARVLAESSDLTLRSTVVGNDPIAVIEVRRTGTPGRVVLRVGESVLGFRLVRVVNRQAVFEKDGVEVELALPMH